MAEEPKKVEPEFASEPPLPPPPPAPIAEPEPEALKDVAEEKPVVPPPPVEGKPGDEAKALVIVEKLTESAVEKGAEGSVHRDAVLARVETEKRISLIRAWEESEKSIAENKAHKKLSEVGAWENSKKSSIDAQLKKIEEKLEKKKAEYVEKMKNKIALIHKEAEEKRATIEAKRGEDLLKAEEMAAKYRAKGGPPKKLLGIF
ncbi:hypothetical protein SAY87_024287 [Trapa incisa]|uniref:Remorin n=2 Tax=Trapa TaxID=22665 RepID=A0AAN7LMR1_TRANT|nr:hypothetical protein SAY87_024287 [Trapa incisa]KAK4789161.1 hypothetical protein SAY86_020480 [Trapa natans]